MVLAIGEGVGECWTGCAAWFGGFGGLFDGLGGGGLDVGGDGGLVDSGDGGGDREVL